MMVGGPIRESDEQLAILAAQRDPSRFADLYDQNFDRIYAYVAARVRDRTEAQDVTSEVFHHALVNLPRFQWRGAPFASWLYRIASNTIADRVKLAFREQTVDPPEAASLEVMEEVEERLHVQALVGELPPDQSKVLLMRFLDQKSIREIADEMQRSEGAIKQLQLRGLQNLRERLGEHDG